MNYHSRILAFMSDDEIRNELYTVSRIFLTILAATSVLLATLFLISCSDVSSEAEGAGTEDDYPDTPTAVVEAFYSGLDSGDCDGVTEFLLFEKLLEIKVYIRNTASSGDIQKLDAEIRGMPEVESVKYITKEMALQSLLESLKEEDAALAGLAGNPLPSSFEIVVKAPRDLENVASRFFDHPIVDNTPGSHDGVTYSGETSWMEFMNGIRDFCERVNSDHDYEISDLKIKNESISDAGEATVNYEVSATMSGDWSNSGEFTLTLVKSDGKWKINGEKRLGELRRLSPFALMLIDIKESRQGNQPQNPDNSGPGTWTSAGLEITAPPAP